MDCTSTDTALGLNCLPDFFGNILMAIIPLIGFLAFIMLLVGGFRILTSAGDAKGLQAGKSTLTLAVVGIVLALASWLILLTIENVTGSPVTQFKFSFTP